MVQRIRQSTAATLRVVFTDEYGEPDARTTVTVGVARANGDVLIAAGTATVAGTGDDVGEFSYQLTPAETSVLDELTATWHDGDNDVDWTTRHRIVGGFMFSIAEARAFDEVLNDSGKYPAALMASKRAEVENEAEWICDRAFVPSYARVTVDGDGTDRLHVGLHDLRSIRSISVYDTLNGTPVEFTAGELAQLSLLPGGVLRRTDGGVFAFGTSNVIVEAEFGLDGPDEMMVAAAITRLKSRLSAPRSGLPERTRSWTDAKGNSYTFTGPDAYRTGVDSVDAVYARHSKRARPEEETGGAGARETMPASRTLSYDPQWNGLFRGGPR